MYMSHPLLRPLTDIMIYDEESDRHVHIPFAQALAATCYGDGVLGDLFNLAGMTDDAAAKFVASRAVVDAALTAAGAAFVAAPAGYGAATVPANPTDFKALGTAAAAAAAAGTDKGQALDCAGAVLACVLNGVWVPAEIVIARPFIEHLMLSAVVCVAGRDTGATLFGPADMQISANTSVKTIEGYARLFLTQHTSIHSTSFEPGAYHTHTPTVREGLSIPAHYPFAT